MGMNPQPCMAAKLCFCDTSTTMNNFLDRFKPPKNGGGGSNSNNNPFSNLFGGGSTKSFSGQGQSLGGNSQPGQVIPIVFGELGPLGIQLEKRSDRETAIVGNIVPGSQAEAAGLQRGDVLCFAGSNGGEEILYDMFLELAKSPQRPLCFEVRRINVILSKPSQSKSADDFARRQAVIAAAEQREKEHKKKQKPIPKTTTDTSKSSLLRSSADKEQEKKERLADQQQQQQEPLSAATIQALALAKATEAKTAQEFGYNPYESKSMNAGQARYAVATSTHGPINQQQQNETTAVVAPNPVGAPLDPASGSGPLSAPEIPDNVQLAFETMITSSNHQDSKILVESLKILKTLIANATTKGQIIGNDKFRTVRLENAKIKAAVTNVVGAMDVLLDCGFQLTHDDPSNESILVYPMLKVIPSWIPRFLQQMEQYIQNS